MKLKCLFKRFVPFLVTLTVGLFIASFFVSVAAPNFQFPKRGWKNRHRDYDRQREFELQRLREENSRLKNRVAEAEKQTLLDMEPKMPEVQFPAPPVPPPPPTMPMKTVPYKAR